MPGRILRQLILVVPLLLAAATCSFERRSSDFACDGPADCPPGRTCTGGWCVVDGTPTFDAADGVDADTTDGMSLIDADLNDAMCPAVCSSCSGGLCTITCATAGSCATQVVCPPGWSCKVECNGSSSCAAGIDCTMATRCQIECTVAGSCTGPLTCADGRRCEIECAAGACTSTIDCDTSCSCFVNCSGDCAMDAMCPAGCNVPQSGSCTANGNCDKCPL